VASLRDCSSWLRHLAKTADHWATYSSFSTVCWSFSLHAFYTRSSMRGHCHKQSDHLWTNPYRCQWQLAYCWIKPWNGCHTPYRVSIWHWSGALYSYPFLRHVDGNTNWLTEGTRIVVLMAGVRTFRLPTRVCQVQWTVRSDWTNIDSNVRADLCSERQLSAASAA